MNMNISNIPCKVEVKVGNDADASAPLDAGMSINASDDYIIISEVIIS